MEVFRTHLAATCVILAFVLVVVGAMLSPGGDLYSSLPYQMAGVVVAVIAYIVLRRRNAHPS